MMWVLLCALLSVCTQHLLVAPLPLGIGLVPEDGKCDDVKCPALNCTNTTKKEGDCCSSCVTIGKYHSNIARYVYSNL